MKKGSGIILGLCLWLTAGAQAKTDVEEAVRNYVEGFYYGDTSKILKSISPQLAKNGFYRAKDKNTYTADTMSFIQCVDYAANVKKRGISPNVEKFPKKIEIFDVQDKTACAKLTAWWGTDYLLLSRIEDKWMITHVLWQSPPPTVK